MGNADWNKRSPALWWAATTSRRCPEFVRQPELLVVDDLFLLPEEAAQARAEQEQQRAERLAAQL